MSNLSDVGFPIQSNEELNKLIESWLGHVVEIPCSKGGYLRFSDPSGAAVYLQMDFGGELTGFNPYFDGKSRRSVNLTEQIERDTSELDGAFRAMTTGDVECPFVFDVPNILVKPVSVPVSCDIQLNAFATNDLKVFADEAEFQASQTDEPKLGAKSFIPIGIFRESEGIPAQAHASFAGEIKEFERKMNHFTGAEFYHLLVETVGGELDVVSDPTYIKNEPQIGSVIHGSFWLTGKVLTD